MMKVVAKHKGKKIDALLKAAGVKAVLVGVLRGTGAHPNAKSGHTIAEIAWWNEFGTKRIPERPFLRWTLRGHNYYREELSRALLATLRGKGDSFRNIKPIGATAARDVRKMISTGPFVANAPATIRKKSTSAGVKARPLIDTGALRQSIQFEVVDDATAKRFSDASTAWMSEG